MTVTTLAIGMFDHYLGRITAQWFQDHTVPAESLHEYDETIAQIAREAGQHNDLESLRLAIDWILLNPEEYSLEDHGGCYPFEDFEVRRILRHLRAQLFPHSAPPDRREVSQVHMVPMTRFDWWDRRESDGLCDPFELAANGQADWWTAYQQVLTGTMRTA